MVNEVCYLSGTLEALRTDGVQIVILDAPDIYSEYAPYSYVDDMKEFIDKVSKMNRINWIRGMGSTPVEHKHPSNP